MNEPVVSVMVKSYQRPFLLGVCLESIAWAWPRDLFEYEVIVADDGTDPVLRAEVERRWGGSLFDKMIFSEAGERKWPLCREGRFAEVVPTCGATWNQAHAEARANIIFLIEDDSYMIRRSSPDACVNAMNAGKSAAQGVNLLCLIGLRERLDLDIHGTSERERVTEPPEGAELLSAAGRVADRVAGCNRHMPERAIQHTNCGPCLAALLFRIAEVRNRSSPAFLDAKDRYGDTEAFALLKHSVWPWSFDGIFYTKEDWDKIGPWPTDVATGPMEWFVQQKLRALNWMNRRYGLAPDPICGFDASCSVRTDHPSTYAGRFRHVDAINAAWLAGEFNPSFEDVRLGRLPWDRTRAAEPMRLHYPRALRQVNFVTGNELCGELSGEVADARWLSQANQEAARYGEAPFEGVPDSCRSA